MGLNAMKTIEFHQIMEWDGADHHIATNLCFSSFDEAKKYKDSYKNHDKITSHRYYVLDSVSEVPAFKSDAKRRNALAKLTDAEIELLGLKR
ncbi:MAG: hypothetical protein RIQ70_201 [Bacteroidota bacterium]